ncbi:MAG TPA: SAM-dependent chlorinase/fluorinase [Pyrinomonadaceae bacterium]
MTSVITLLTDFGTADYFVAAVKGVIITSNPRVSIIDVTHEIPPQDIESGAFTLLTCYRDFPAGTIHVAVVDPGVGSSRRPIVVSAGSHYFVGPDNGLFSYVYDNEPSHETFHITADEYFRQPVSSSFHGRDVFAPIAAALSKGIQPHALGPRITDEVRLTPLSPVKQNDGNVEGRIIHIDRFGNCITNFTPADTPGSKQPELLVNGQVIRTVRGFFTDEHGAKDEVFAIWGSAGFLELSINGRSAAAHLRAHRGDAVILSA